MSSSLSGHELPRMRCRPPGPATLAARARQAAVFAPMGPTPRAVTEPTPTLVMREAINGGGVALADTIMAEDLMKRGLLVSPFPIRHRIKAGYYIKQRPGAGSKPGIRQFRAWLLAEIEQHKREMRL